MKPNEGSPFLSDDAERQKPAKGMLYVKLMELLWKHKNIILYCIWVTFSSFSPVFGFCLVESMGCLILSILGRTPWTERHELEYHVVQGCRVTRVGITPADVWLC